LLIPIYWPFLQTFLKTHPLGLREWALIISLGVFEIVAIELGKLFFIVRRKEKRALALRT